MNEGDIKVDRYRRDIARQEKTVVGSWEQLDESDRRYWRDRYYSLKSNHTATEHETADKLGIDLDEVRDVRIQKGGELKPEEPAPTDDFGNNLGRRIDSTLNERGARYGDFRDHAVIAQQVKAAMTHAPGADTNMWKPRAGWSRLAPYQKQALEVIADKIARILNGDPDYADNWHDIQGYAKLVEDRLPKTVKK